MRRRDALSISTAGSRHTARVGTPTVDTSGRGGAVIVRKAVAGLTAPGFNWITNEAFGAGTDVTSRGVLTPKKKHQLEFAFFCCKIKR